MIRGSNRVVSSRPPDASFGIHNRFVIEVIDSETGRVKQKANAYNVICDQLWTKLFEKTNYFSYIQYGSGDGTPSVSDKSLFNYVGYELAGGAVAEIDYEKGVFSATRQIQLAAGTAVGVTITEVGIAHSATSSSLCTHAMLEDMNGNRVSIAKTDTDVINIYATVYVHFNPHGYDGGHIRPTTCVPTRSIFAYLCGISNELPDRMYLTECDTSMVEPYSYGGIPRVSSNVNANYVAVSVTTDISSKTVTFTAARLEANAHNIGGFRYLNLWRYSYGSVSNMYEPWCIVRPGGTWFPHSVITSEAVGTGDGSTVDYSLDFPFVSDVKVYIDGVETTDFTYDYAPNTSTGLTCYMQELHPASTVDCHIDRVHTSYGGLPFTRIFYNPAHGLGIATLAHDVGAEVYASNDLTTWDMVLPATSTGFGRNVTGDVPSEYANHKYWKVVHNSSGLHTSMSITPPATFTGKTLHFNTPPAEGAVITADYKTDTIAKDANHVFDFSLTIKLGEYVES